MMAVVLALHPITLPFSWFFLFQIPGQLLLDVLVYPLFPMYDTPYIDWTDYLLYLVKKYSGKLEEEDGAIEGEKDSEAPEDKSADGDETKNEVE